MLSWVCRVGDGDMVLEILSPEEGGRPGDVEGIEFVDSAGDNVWHSGGSGGIKSSLGVMPFLLYALEMGVIKVRFLKGLEGIFNILGHEVCNLSLTVGHGIIICHFSDMISTATQAPKFFHSGVKFFWCMFYIYLS